jgi:hypothetical protein
MRKYLLPITLGFAGMLISHVLILLGFASGISFPLYFFAYPIVYSIIVFLLTRRNPEWWFSNVIGICLIPFLYWFILLSTEGKLHWTDAINITDSSGMLLILPVTFLISAFVSLSQSGFKKPGHKS